MLYEGALQIAGVYGCGHVVFRKGREDERATLDVSTAVPRTELAREDG